MSDYWKVLVTGGRGYRGRAEVYQALDDQRLQHGEMMVCQGGATGADLLADQWAKAREVPVLRWPARWRAEPRWAAGGSRNQRMIDWFEPSIVLAFPGGSGTADCVRRAAEAGILTLTWED